MHMLPGNKRHARYRKMNFSRIPQKHDVFEGGLAVSLKFVQIRSNAFVCARLARRILIKNGMLRVYGEKIRLAAHAMNRDAFATWF
jgi:hypothetical protein